MTTSPYIEEEPALEGEFRDARFVTFFLAGDVMTGRGIDQFLPHSVDPVLYEPVVTDAREYVALADDAHGPLPQSPQFSYIWGDALKEMKKFSPELRIINLETSVTADGQPWPGKGIHYRMHPRNIGCINAADIDFCSLANNHVIDWGYDGIEETLGTLKEAGLQFAGAGLNLQQAVEPAKLTTVGNRRVAVFAFGLESSGIPDSWAASEERPGIFLAETPMQTLASIKCALQALGNRPEIIVASIHWGSNWGYEIEKEQQEFAHQLIDEAGVDLVHGHSSHHFKGIEVHRERLILFGCGDLINDYEGIRGHEEFRPDLSLLYFPVLHPSSGKLMRMQMIPMQMKRFRLNHVSRSDAEWIKKVLNREGARLGTSVEITEHGIFMLNWNSD